jgi:hypothetical protein
MHFLVSDFSPALFVSPVLGAIVGATYRYVRGPTYKATGELRGIESGAIFGVGAGIIWIMSTCWWIPLTNSSQIIGYGYMTVEVTICATVFGILVGVAIEMILDILQYHQASLLTSPKA